MERRYRYLIVGGGMAADAAVRGIRQVDSDGSIGLIGAEPDPPYNRPPLSKSLWKKGPRPMPLSRIWRGTANLGADLHLGRAAAALDPSLKRVIDSQGEEYAYERLLLATGADPIRLVSDHRRVIAFRTLADYHRLRALCEEEQRFAVIGGGFIGSEIAAALAGLGKEVTMIFPEGGIGARLLPPEIAGYLNEYFRERGVRVLTGHLVQALDADETGITLRTDLGEVLRAGAAVTGLGVRPNLTLAASAGLATGIGIEVDSFLRAGREDVYAAGDVAGFPYPPLGKRIRAEHEENANLTGFIAGQNIAGERVAYQPLPWVYSDLFDLHYDAVGVPDPNLVTLFDWQEPLQKGAVYFLNGDRVSGVLLWNLPRGLEAARQVIQEPGPLHAPDLIGRITG